MSPRSKTGVCRSGLFAVQAGVPKEKTRILNEFCATCGYHRKYAIRLLRGFKRFAKPKRKKRGRRPSVSDSEAILKPLKRIWLGANLPCSKRLKAILVLWLPGYAESFEPLSLEVIKALKRISPATIDRLMKPVRTEVHETREIDHQTGDALAKNRSPSQTNQWDEARPGFLEADTVAHCGDTTAGTYVNTVDFVDIATSWTEQRAVWGKGETRCTGTDQGRRAVAPFSAARVSIATTAPSF